jgi:hypothetical protein
MNSFKTPLLTKSILAAAVAASGLAAPALSQANPTGTSDDGVVCRAGYTGALIGSRFVCSKTSSTDIKLECTSPNFPVYVIRLGGPGPDGDKDICIRDNGTVITINQSLNGLTQSTNGISGVYEFAKVNPATLTAEIAAKDSSEALGLSLKLDQVDTRGGTPVVKANGRAGGRGEATVPLTFYTYAVPGPTVVQPATGGQVINQQGANNFQTPAFAPRPLP